MGISSLIMLILAGTKDNVIQSGTVNLHFLIPGTSEPISATVSVLCINQGVLTIWPKNPEISV